MMVTALGKGDTILEALKTGAKDFISKPFTYDKVISSVMDVLK